jgi:hypothetical protein
MRNRKLNYRQRAIRTDIVKSTALLGGIFLCFWVLPDAIRKADCVEATRQIKSGDACLAYSSCVMTKRETQAHMNWIRLQALSCHKEES